MNRRSMIKLTGAVGIASIAPTLIGVTPQRAAEIEQSSDPADKKRLITLPARCISMDSTIEAVNMEPPHEAYHRGFWLFWSGWKSDYKTWNIAGQWIGWIQGSAEFVGLFSAIPGGVGLFKRGETFDLTPQKGQICLVCADTRTPIGRLRLSAYKQDALDRLINYIDQQLDSGEMLDIAGVKDQAWWESV